MMAFAVGGDAVVAFISPGKTGYTRARAQHGLGAGLAATDLHDVGACHGHGRRRYGRDERLQVLSP